jgi:acyl CoA:acetate/3-ketoacid CoA transferase alpha subunit
MTISIGDWGWRRELTSLVRAILRSGPRYVTVVSYGGPDVVEEWATVGRAGT